MLRIVVVRPAGENTWTVYYFDGARFLSCALQRLGAVVSPKRGHWRNERRWVPSDAPPIPEEIRAEVRRRVRLSGPRGA